MYHIHNKIFAVYLTSATLTLASFAEDAAPVNANTILQELRHLSDQRDKLLSQQRQTALVQVTAAAASADQAVGLWEDAVRAVQFDGVPKENAAFRDWKENQGAGLHGPAAKGAARLFFSWLSLTMQREAGASVKDLLPRLIAYTQDLAADRRMADALGDSIDKQKEAAQGGRHAVPQPKPTSEQVKRMHDQILNTALAGSAVVQWLNLGPFVQVEKWEAKPGNLDGIFTNIILPELRDERDPRVLEYWDVRLKEEANDASDSKLSFEIDKFNNERRPRLLWNQAEDMMLIGQKNRGITQMFNLVKTYPRHPDADNWISKIESLLAPPAAAVQPSAPGTTP